MKNVICIRIWAVVWGCFLFLMYPQYASAYLDPGTGSYILQIVIAAILGGVFMVKPFFAKIQHFFRKVFSRKHRDDQSAE